MDAARVSPGMCGMSFAASFMSLGRWGNVMNAAAPALLLVLAIPRNAYTQSVTGVLADSLLSVGPLANAVIWIPGRSDVTQTDRDGRFRLHGLPAGSHTLTFSHPAFDTAGIAPPRWHIEVPAQGLHDLVLTIPGPDRRFGSVCAGRPGPNAGYLIGSVRDAATDSTSAGVTVDVHWIDPSPKEPPVQPKQGTARTQTDANGQFVLCPVPTSARLSLRATGNGATTGSIVLSLAGRRLAVRHLAIASQGTGTRTPADSAALVAQVHGKVADANGQSIAGARVSVGVDGPAVMTDASGAFTLFGAPAGTHVLVVGAVGHEPGWRAVDLRPGPNLPIELVVGRAVQTLAPIEVVGRATLASDLPAIKDRVRRAGGLLLTVRDIEKRRSRRFEDLVRGVPGLQVVPIQPPDGFDNFTGEERVVSSRGIRSIHQPQCAPAYLVDGTPIELELGEGTPFAVPVSDIRALEMYPSTATAPFEFQRAQSGCGLIVVWTKKGGRDD